VVEQLAPDRQLGVPPDEHRVTKPTDPDSTDVPGSTKLRTAAYSQAPAPVS
jgi:hypothetical protein